MSDIIERKVSELKQHSLNAEIYGDGIDKDFLENIREFGIQSPITVCKSFDPELNDVIVKGRRRAIASMKAGVEVVPTVEWLCDDPDEVQKQLILDNVRNPVTPEQQARMFIELRRIEAKKIKSQIEETEDLPDPSAVAAAAAGMSQKTAERASHAVRVADKLKEEGRENEASEIIDTLNNKSAFAAAKKASDAIGKKTRVSKPQEEQHQPESEQEASQPVSSAGDDVDRHLSKTLSLLKSLEDSIGPLVRSIDNKLAEDKGFAGHHRLLINKMRLFGDELDKVVATSGVLKEMWSSAKRG